MKKNLKLMFLSIIVMMVFVVFACSKTKQTETKKETQMQNQKSNTQNTTTTYQNDFTLLNIMTYEDFTLSSFQGKIVILDFWATWCPPCRMQVPVLMSIYEKYKDKGLEIVGISLDRGGSKVVADFVEKNGVTYTIVEGDSDVVDIYGGIEGIPTLFILDKNGNILKKHVGFMKEADLIEEIERVL